MILTKEILIGILVALFLASAVGGYNYWKEYQEKKLDEVATLVYLYEKGDLKKEEVELKVKGTPYYPYFLAVSGGKAQEVLKNLKDENLKKLYLEKTAFELYKEGKKEDSLNKLNSITEKDFNYPSALLLKAQINDLSGKTKEAKKLYEEIVEKYSNTYFARIATARLLELQ